ncbi:MAG: hypothetical protein JST25_06160 [Actinobacteria bacterium]|nr:hypothetical protein [Actinomycetota bacterium]
MRPSTLTIAAAVLLALESAVLLVLTLIEVFDLSSGDASSLPSGLGLIGLSAVGATGLAVFAFGVLRGRSYGRSGGMVVQILAVAVAFSALSVRPFPVVFVLSLLIPAVAGIVMLFLLSRQAGAEARRIADADADED